MMYTSPLNTMTHMAEIRYVFDANFIIRLLYKETY